MIVETISGDGGLGWSSTGRRLRGTQRPAAIHLDGTVESVYANLIEI